MRHCHMADTMYIKLKATHTLLNVPGSRSCYFLPANDLANIGVT